MTQARAAVIGFVAALAAGAASAQTLVPDLMNYQGKLTDASGRVLTTADYNLAFRIWDAASGGSMAWGPQTLSAVPVVQGYFNVVLGNDDGARPVGSAFAGSDTRYLEVTVAGTPILPRQRIVSTAYALRAQVAADAEFAAASRATFHVQGALPQLGIGVAPAAFPAIPGLRLWAKDPGITGWQGLGAFGGGAKAVVVGELDGKATLGAHNANLGAWADLRLGNPGVNLFVESMTKLGGNPAVAPVNQLEVVGNARIEGSLTLKGQAPMMVRTFAIQNQGSQDLGIPSNEWTCSVADMWNDGAVNVFESTDGVNNYWAVNLSHAPGGNWFLQTFMPLTEWGNWRGHVICYRNELFNTNGTATPPAW